MKDRSDSLRILSTVKDNKGSPPPPKKKFFGRSTLLSPERAVAVHREEGSGRAREKVPLTTDSDLQQRPTRTCRNFMQYNYMFFKNCSKFNSEIVGQKGDKPRICAISSKESVHSRPISTIQRQLAADHGRPVGPKHHPGLWDRVYDPPSSAPPSLRTSLFHSGILTTGGGDTEVAREGSNSEGTLYKQDQGFYSSLFLVQKKGGGLRPIINLKSLNEFIPTVHFKMVGMHTVKDLLRQNDWLTKVDLKGAYFMITIREVDRPDLHFLAQQSPVSVHLSTIRPFMCSMGLNQDPEASDIHTQRVGDKASAAVAEI